MLIVFSLLLQSAAGTVTRAAASSSAPPPNKQCVAQRSVDFAEQTVEQAPDELVQSTETTSPQDCINGLCGGISCRCPCHGMIAAIFLPAALPLEPPAVLDAPLPLLSLASIGVNPPVRPPKV